MKKFKLNDINYDDYISEQKERKIFYVKLLAKLKKIQNKELDLNDYIKEVEEKISKFN